MRFLSVCCVLLSAVLTVALAAGCETHDRVLYQYDTPPLRIPNYKPRPLPASSWGYQK